MLLLLGGQKIWLQPSNGAEVTYLAKSPTSVDIYSSVHTPLHNQQWSRGGKWLRDIFCAIKHMHKLGDNPL